MSLTLDSGRRPRDRAMNKTDCVENAGAQKPRVWASMLDLAILAQPVLSEGLERKRCPIPEVLYDALLITMKQRPDARAERHFARIGAVIRRDLDVFVHRGRSFRSITSMPRLRGHRPQPDRQSERYAGTSSITWCTATARAGSPRMIYLRRARSAWWLPSRRIRRHPEEPRYRWLDRSTEPQGRRAVSTATARSF